MKEMREELDEKGKEVPELESKKEKLSDECGSFKEELKAKEAAIAAQLEKVKKADTQLAEAS